MILHVVLARNRHRDDAVRLADVREDHAAHDVDEHSVLGVLGGLDQTGEIDEGEVAALGSLHETSDKVSMKGYYA